MTRRHLTFPCKGETLVGTLDDATGTTGLLIVSGGNETRSGPFAGQADLAARLARGGFPVFRFDRRGVGDSSGANGGFRSAQPDIAAAMAAFRIQSPLVDRIVAFGNCDAASALMLGGGCGADALVLANPWTFDEGQDCEMPPAAIRARYREKLRNPRELARLFSGKVSLRGVIGSLGKAAETAPSSKLGKAMAARMLEFGAETRVLLAGRDRTAHAFRSNTRYGEACIQVRDGADHAFSDPADQAWLEQQLIEVLGLQP